MGRRLGQHFLSDPSILRRIADAACPQPCPLVVEIGPGKGALTRHLLERAERVVAIELDSGLAERLTGLSSRLEVVAADVLDTGLGAWGQAAVAGNLPYYITSPIIEKTLALGSLCTSATFLVQREVAVRITASPGSRDYGYLSVSVQCRANPEYLFTVRPGSFSPPPKVESAVIRLLPRVPEAQPVEPFLQFVSQCFLHKRKTLKNNLLQNYDTNRLEGWPELNLRAEQLSVEQLSRMFQRL